MKTVLLDQNNEVQIIVSGLSELHSSFVNGGGGILWGYNRVRLYMKQSRPQQLNLESNGAVNRYTI